MKFIALKTKDGKLKGDIFFYCRTLHVSRQGFYQYLANKDRPWKYQPLADAMMEILEEDDCNDTYGRIRMYQALMLKQPENVDIPSERTVYRVMEDIGISHHPRRNSRLKGGERHPTAEKTLRHIPTKNDKRKTVKAVAT